MVNQSAAPTRGSCLPPRRPIASALALVAILGPAAAQVRVPREPDRAWRIVGGGPASAGGVFSTQIEVAPDGTPHVAFMDLTAQFQRLNVRRIVNGVWEPLTTTGSGTIGQAWYNRLAFGSSGELIVASRDYGLSGALGVRRCGAPGAPWQTLGGGAASASDAHYTDVVVRPDATVAVVFQDRSLSPVDRTTVLVSTATGWIQASGSGLGQGYCAFQSIACRDDGSLLVGFTDGAYGARGTVLELTNGTHTWHALGVPGFTPEMPNNMVVRVAPDGTPYVAYYVWNSRVVVRRFDGASWTQLGQPVDGFDLPTVETEGWRQWLGFEIDAAGRPVVAYQAANLGRRAVVKRWDPASGAWVAFGAEGFTPAAADYLALALARDGTPYVAYRDGASGCAFVMGWR